MRFWFRSTARRAGNDKGYLLKRETMAGIIPPFSRISIRISRISSRSFVGPLCLVISSASSKQDDQPRKL